jgi:hypothetical protein
MADCTKWHSFAKQQAHSQHSLFRLLHPDLGKMQNQLSQSKRRKSTQTQLKSAKKRSEARRPRTRYEIKNSNPQK